MLPDWAIENTDTGFFMSLNGVYNLVKFTSIFSYAYNFKLIKLLDGLRESWSSRIGHLKPCVAASFVW